jgi:hypothetical protein
MIAGQNGGSTKLRGAVIAALAFAFIAGCGDDPASPPEGGGDPENISTVTVTLVGGGSSQTSTRRDPDGTQLPQPVGAASATLTLAKGVTYAGTMVLLNDIDPNNIIDITDEVHEEANFHRFIYSTTGASCSGVTFQNFDLDTQNPPQPVGITFQMVIPANAASGSCTLHIELHHFEQNKGDGLGSNFETDLSMDFPVTIP